MVHEMFRDWVHHISWHATSSGTSWSVDKATTTCHCSIYIYIYTWNNWTILIGTLSGTNWMGTWYNLVQLDLHAVLTQISIWCDISMWDAFDSLQSAFRNIQKPGSNESNQQIPIFWGHYMTDLPLLTTRVSKMFMIWDPYRNRSFLELFFFHLDRLLGV